MNPSSFLNPFVLPTTPTAVERRGRVDLYLPLADDPLPVVVFVHGGPVPPDQRPTPRDWPVFVGYASAVAERGVVAVTLDHRLHGPDGLADAADDVAAAVAAARDDDRVDADRVALWFFSGGGLLMADWLAAPPAWLRCVAATYPLLAGPPGTQLPQRFRPLEAVAAAPHLPIVLSRAGLERPWVAETVAAFVAAAGAAPRDPDTLIVIDAPNGQHGFDYLDHTEESRQAVVRAIDTVTGLVRSAS